MDKAATGGPVVIVSSDTHIGPRLREDLRPYCEASLLGAFDEFTAGIDAHRAAVYAKVPGRAATAQTANRQTAGHHDPHARLRDHDHDGIAAEIIFHGSQNEEPIPWGTFVVFLGPSSDDPSLVAAGATHLQPVARRLRLGRTRPSRRPGAAPHVGCRCLDT